MCVCVHIYIYIYMYIFTPANCSIRDPNICQKTYTIYRLICLKCHNFYIGSTIRNFHIRIKEQFNTHASSFHKYFIK